MAQYEDFIPENVALPGTRRIGIYNRKGNRVGFIPLGNLKKPNGTKQYSFGALSDVHLQYDTAQADFIRGLQHMNEEGVLFTCICGDLTDHGYLSELQEYKNYVDTYAQKPVYAIAGNHEYGGDHNNIAGVIEAYTGKPLYYSFTQGNDVFIMVGIKGNSEGTLFADGELQWLYETLEANRNKRCFVFQHVRPQDGCGNAFGIYNYDIWGGTEATVFESLMRHYKNAHLFHGHSHLKFYLQRYDGADNANIAKDFGGWSIHIPSLAVPRDGDPSGASSRKEIYADSEGYVVDVYENAIHLRGRDFVKGEYLPIASYWLDTTLKEVAAGTYVDETNTITAWTEIAYIESADTQYINTGFIPDSNCRLVADCVSCIDDDYNDVFGCRSSTSSRGFAFSTTAKNWRFGYGKSVDTGVPWDTERHIVEINKNVLSLDGVVIYTAEATEFTCAYPLCLCAIKGSSMYWGYARFYSCQIYDGSGTMVRDLIPCKKTNGEVGMWDKVNKVFYGNAGTGEFIYA